jgi:hypothetical protein
VRHLSAHACETQSNGDLVVSLRRAGLLPAVKTMSSRFIHVGPCQRKLPALDAVSETLLFDLFIVVVVTAAQALTWKR